jgi:2-polyprenyl-3-methyl-5-hydroxy-6-metoxy-1,4-benzoquinol methylase
MHRISASVGDASEIQFDADTFDVVVAYGLLHCLDDVKEIEDVVGRIRGWIRPNGYFVGATFTDTVPPPEVQGYLDEESLLPVGHFQGLFEGWQMLAQEDEVITESHPTSLVEHNHSICRVLAQRP